MTRFSTDHSITPAEQQVFEARARKLRSDVFRHFFAGLIGTRSHGAGPRRTFPKS
ncbi:hypothetical protein [Roseibium aquae]|uniref:hypothetical protein n=1 Tax=Roseibium aquae TaxID=1323746 RepID=UPI00156296CF|nr:hypothetical protein [Roseibium aquae]